MKRFKTKEIQQHEIDHAKVVRERAAECTLFLKRNSDFPIKPCSVNLYGSGARRTIKGGKGSGDVNTRYSISVEQGLENAGFVVTTKSWLDKYDEIAEQAVKDFWDGLVKEAEEMNTSPYYLIMDRSRPSPEYECDMTGTGELNIYVIARDSSEGIDRKEIKGDYLLLDSEVRDIKELAARKEKYLLVLNVGGVLDLSPILDDVQNILLLSQLGAETGNVFADILTGKSNPSGKLTTTWAKSLADYPSTKSFGTQTEVEYIEGCFVGYRYFDSFDIEPQFAFGYGKSYTDFNFVPTKYEISGNQVTVNVRVTNVGSYSGKEVIQAYYTKVDDKVMPAKQLIAFNKTGLLSASDGQDIRLKFDMTDAATYVEARSAFVLESGEYQIHIGNSMDNTVCACSITVKDNFVTEPVHKLTSAKIDELKYTGGGKAAEKPLLGVAVFAPIQKSKKKVAPYKSSKVDDMTNEQLIRLCVGVLNDMTLSNNIGNSGKKVAGSAGETYSDESIAPLVLADGPAGLRISPTYKLDENGRVMASENSLAGIVPGGALKVEDSEETYYQYCTATPVGTALAQTWNERLCEEIGDIVGKEMQLFDVDIWLAPALNIHRSPLCGRNFEYYSEDPLLSGLVAAAITNGVQRNEGCSVTIKHFCANNQERDRFFSSSNMSERTLREIYLKGFKVCIEKSNPNAMMSSYNLVNGTHTANSKELLTDVLRDEWGWEGLIMTDWLATGGMGTGVVYGPSTARGCIAASNDLIMPGRDEDYNDILAAVNEGEISREQLEMCASRVLNLSERKGIERVK